jgi:hypothetical protein
MSALQRWSTSQLDFGGGADTEVLAPSPASRLPFELHIRMLPPCSVTMRLCATSTSRSLKIWILPLSSVRMPSSGTTKSDETWTRRRRPRHRRVAQPIELVIKKAKLSDKFLLASVQTTERIVDIRETLHPLSLPAVTAVSRPICVDQLR